jgi:uncharacterized Zn-finger protein
LAAAAIAIPVLHWFGLRNPGADVGWCPFCGTRLSDRSHRAVACPDCGRRFTVRAA